MKKNMKVWEFALLLNVCAVGAVLYSFLGIFLLRLGSSLDVSDGRLALVCITIGLVSSGAAVVAVGYFAKYLDYTAPYCPAARWIKAPLGEVKEQSYDPYREEYLRRLISEKERLSPVAPRLAAIEPILQELHDAIETRLLAGRVCARDARRLKKISQ